MSNSANLELELIAQQEFNTELVEENERLRVENATLRDKLAQKGVEPPETVRHAEDAVDALVMRGLISASEMLDMVAPRHQRATARAMEYGVIIEFEYLPEEEYFRFKIQYGGGTPQWAQVDRRTISYMPPHQLENWIEEIARKMLHAGGAPQINEILNATAHELLRLLTEETERGRHQEVHRYEWYERFSPSGKPPKRGLVRDRHTGGNPRSPFQRGGS